MNQICDKLTGNKFYASIIIIFFILNFRCYWRVWLIVINFLFKLFYVFLFWILSFIIYYLFLFKLFWDIINHVNFYIYSFSNRPITHSKKVCGFFTHFFDMNRVLYRYNILTWCLTTWKTGKTQGIWWKLSGNNKELK